MRLVLPLLMALAFAAAPAETQNLVFNGELDTDDDGWSDPGIDQEFVDWTAEDHGACAPSSGSGRIRNDISEETFDIASRSTCVTGIVPGASYTLEGWLAFPAGETEDAMGDLAVHWYSSTSGCQSASFIDNSPLSPQVFTSTPDEWIRVALDPLVAPANAHNAQVRVRVTKLPAGGTVHLYFDGIHLVEGAGYLFGDDFEVGSRCRWSVP